MKVIALLALLVAAVSAIAPLLHADSDMAIAGSYIVVLKPELSIVQRDVHVNQVKDIISLDATIGEVTGVFGILDLIGYFARLSPALLKELLEHPQVLYIEQDQVFSISSVIEPEPEAPLAILTQTGATWGLDRVDQRDLPLNGLFIYDDRAGSGVDSYIIDTGVLATHNEFSGRASGAFNAITNEANTDLNGHGTHVSGTIGGNTYGVAKKTTIYGVKVLAGNGSGTTAGVISGVDYVTRSRSTTRRSVANMSLGGGASTTLDTSVANSVTAGVIYAVAAGNDNANACNGSPARVTSAITVGASTNTDARSSFSNIGTCVNLFAPGSSITSSYIGSNSATSVLSGTSMASPHVAGVAALHASVDPSLAPAQYQNWFQSAATLNKITNPGTGSPNRLLYSPY